MQKKISVITPSYNQGQFIEEAILSVLKQDYPNFEHLVIDGGSSDNTIQILKKYSHLKWISEPDKGQSDALNKGFMNAEGEIFAWLNADDFFIDSAFQNFINFYSRTEYSDYYYANYYWVNKNGNYIKTIKPYKRYSYFFNLFYGCYIPTSGSFIKKSFFDKVGMLSTEFRYKMDTEIFERAGKANVKFQKMPFTTSAFRYHGNNVSFRDKENEEDFLSKQEMESIIIKDRFFEGWAIDLKIRQHIYTIIWYLAKYLYLLAKYSKI